MFVPREDKYDSAAAFGHYKGRSRKDTPASKAVAESLLVRRYDKTLRAKNAYSIQIGTDDLELDPLIIEDARGMSNPTIEEHSDKLVLISNDDNATITIETKNPGKALDTIFPSIKNPGKCLEVRLS